MFVDDLVKKLKGEKFSESAIRWAIHEGRAAGLWFIRDLTRQGIDESGVRRREGPFIQPKNYGPPCSVDLSREKPVVFGKEMNPLTAKERVAVQLLRSAYPDGLSTAELKEKFGDGDPFATLRDLRRKDKAWKRAIIMPGRAKQGQKYRLAPLMKNPRKP
jgi:hypothetical protein